MSESAVLCNSHHTLFEGFTESGFFQLSWLRPRWISRSFWVIPIYLLLVQTWIPVIDKMVKHLSTCSNENAGALARPPATCPPCHYSKQKVLLTVIFLVCSKYNCDVVRSGDMKTSRRDVTWHRVVTSHGIKCHEKWMCATYTGHPIEKNWKSCFFQN